MAAEQLTLEIKDYATLAMTGAVDGAANTGQLARVNSLREEPGGASRLFVVDMNGPLYVVDKKTKKASVYLDFDGRDKGQIVALLKESFRKSLEEVRAGGLNREAELFGQKTTRRGVWATLDTHVAEHLGQAIAYARVNGITPPWSEGGK